MLSVLAIYVFSIAVDDIFFSHSIIRDNNEWKNYMHLFKAPYIKDVDKFTRCTYVKKNDIYMSFNYVPGISTLNEEEQHKFRLRGDTAYFVTIWEFKKLGNLPVDSVKLRFCQSLDDLSLKWGEILEPDSEEPVSINFRYRFKKMNINVDNKSEITNPYVTGENYNGFIGQLNRVSLSNEKEKHKIFIDYKPKKAVLFLIVNKNSHFYIITISCNKKFDEKIIEILNLK